MTTEERLEKVERELAETCADLLKLRADLAKQVETRALRVVDENGKPRVGLAVIEGGASLVLFDENGKSRAVLSVDKDRARLRLFDENGKPRVGLAADDKDRTWRHLFLAAEPGKVRRVGLGLLRSGPSLVLLDENGNFRATLVVNEDGVVLGLADEKGKHRAWLHVDKERPILRLLDKNGKAIWSAP